MLNGLPIRDYLEFLLRLLLSAGFGLLIGLERSQRQKDAGIRTHLLVAVSSAAFMIVSKYAFADLGEAFGTKTADPARIAAQVVSGVSFLGAGVIFKDRNSSIKGLTTAAGLWATSAVGLALGAGLYFLGIVLGVFILLSQMVLHRFPIGGDALTSQEMIARVKEGGQGQEAIETMLKRHDAVVEQSNLSRESGEMLLRLRYRTKNPLTHEECMALMKDYPDIRQISI